MHFLRFIVSFKQLIYKDSQSAKKLVGKSILGIAWRIGAVESLLGEQTMLDVDVEGVLVHRLI